ncbi:MAG: DegT/DnrJ/EryC1/StrS family aminotransferase [Solirubrobacterales bacterium]
MPIQITRSSLPPIEEYMEEIKELWETHWLTNMGEKHKQLEAELCSYLDTPNISLFSNGHFALECILEAFELEGEVITTPFTFASTTHAIVRKGLKPVFCDINYQEYTIDADKIEKLITKNTKAIVPVHVYGNICDVEKINDIAKQYNLKVIYDAAHAFGVKCNGKSISSFGDASMFSFHATKVFNTIEGGGVTYKDSTLSSKLNQLKNFGITSAETIERVAGNGKMNEFQAAMGICNLRHVDKQIEMRKEAVKRYTENLKNINGIKIYKNKTGIESNYSYFPVIFDGFKLSRDEVFEKLKKYEIFTRKYFFPLTSSFECYKGIFDSSLTPVAEKVAATVLTLPLYADLDIKTIDRICEIILN